VLEIGVFRQLHFPFIAVSKHLPASAAFMSALRDAMRRSPGTRASNVIFGAIDPA
jgi:hypothetical protein